jgi:hypothetical protein
LEFTALRSFNPEGNINEAKKCLQDGGPALQFNVI